MEDFNHLELVQRASSGQGVKSKPPNLLPELVKQTLENITKIYSSNTTNINTSQQINRSSSNNSHSDGDNEIMPRGSTSQHLKKRESSSTESKEDSLNKHLKLEYEYQNQCGFTSGFKKLRIGNRIAYINTADIKEFEEKDKNQKTNSVFFKMTNNFYKNKQSYDDLETDRTVLGFSSNPRNPF